MPRLIQRLQSFGPVPEWPDDVRHIARRIRNVLLAVLLYDQDQPLAGSELSKILLNYPDLLRDLNNQFFDKLYVYRAEVAEIASLLELRRLVVVRGHRGSGKSTILRQLMRELESRPPNETTEVSISENEQQTFNPPNRSTHYINLQEMFGELEGADKRLRLGIDLGDLRQPIETVCQRVYDLLYGELLENAADESILAAWNVFWLKVSSVDAEFRNIVRDALTPRNDADWLRVLHSQDLQDKRVAMRTAVSDNPGTERLQRLLEFLAITRGHEVVLLIDNIDRYSLALQQDVIDKCIDFANAKPPLVTPVVAVRFANFARLNTEALGDYTHVEQELGATTAQVPQGRARKVDVANDDRIVADFMLRRLRMAVEHLEADTDSRLQIGASTLIGDFLNRHIETFNWFAVNVPYVAPNRRLASWHNQSLRDVASSAFAWINRMLMGQDLPFYCRGLSLLRPEATFADSIEDEGAKATPTTSASDLRTLLYRHMIFADRSPPRDITIVPVLSTDGRPLELMTWYMLQYLAARRSNGAAVCDLTEILDAFAQFGVSNADVFATLRQMAEHDSVDRPRWVLIDVPDEKLSKLSKLIDDATGAKNGLGDIVVELLPSGHFVVDRLVSSCEHLFWSGLYQDLEKPLFDGPLTYARICDDGFRVKVAAQFALQSIVPALTRDFNRMAQLDSIIHDRFCGYFDGTTAATRYLGASCRKSLANYVGEIDFRDDDGIVCRDLISQIPTHHGAKPSTSLKKTQK